MQLGSYTLAITNKSEQGGYVHMNHGEEYAIFMSNDSGKRVEAELRIDGEIVGTWRLNAYQSGTIERPANVPKKFAFYASDSREGQMVGAALVASLNRGVVGVTFYPEKQAEPQVYRHPHWTYTNDSSQTLSYGGSSMRSAGPTGQSLASGVTGLTGHSNQSFGSAAALMRDYANAITIELRLVVDQSEPQPLPGRVRKISAPPPIN